MRKIILMILLSILIVINIFPKVSSRIEGVVTDVDTGLPIKGAELILYEYSVKLNSKIFDFKTISDRNGKFRFDSGKVEYLISPNFYYLIQCKHKSYVDLYPRVPLRIGEYLKTKVFNIFTLKEGEIKFLKINLDKGGNIAGNVKYNDGTGIKSLKNYSFELIRDLNPYGIPDAVRGQYKYARITTDENGDFLKNGIPPNSGYYLQFFFNGYTAKKSNFFSITKGQKTILMEILDLSDKTGIKGVVTIDGQTPTVISVTAFYTGVNNINKENVFCTYYSNLNNYFIYNLAKGNYSFNISALNDSKRYERELIIKLKKNKTLLLNIDFTEKDRK